MQKFIIFILILVLCSCSSEIRQSESQLKGTKFQDSHRILKDIRSNSYVIICILNPDVKLEIINPTKLYMVDGETVLEKGNYILRKEGLVRLLISDDGIFVDGNKIQPNNLIIVNKDGSIMVSL